MSDVDELIAVVLPDVALPATDGSTVRLTELGTGRTVLHASEGRFELPDAGAALVGVRGPELVRALGRPDVDGLTLVVHDGRIEHVFACDTPPVDVAAWLREHPA